MKYIGLIKTDDLPSTSIGLRVSEMAKLGFSQIILYAKTRTTVAKQFRRGTVVSDEQKLKEEIEKQGDCLVVIAAKHSVDANGIKALGEPKEMECRCLTGQRFVGCTSEGDRSIVKVFEYDRRRGVSRFDRGDSGDVRIDAPNNKGLMVMRSSGFLKMLEQGDSFIAAGDDFQKTADAVGVSVTCADPISAGVSWHSGMIHDEKKPINVVYGERVSKNKSTPSVAEPSIKTEKYSGNVYVGMATYHAMEKSMLAVVKALHGQCDKMFVALNGYDQAEVDRVKKLASYKNVVFTGYTDADDLGCQNKYRGVSNCDDGDYFLTVDDDFVYPADYVRTMVMHCNEKNGAAVISCHGRTIPLDEDGRYDVPRRFKDLYEITECVNSWHRVDVAGGGAGITMPTKIGLTFDVFMKPKNTGDDELLAIWAHKNNVPMFVVPHKRHWITNSRVVTDKKGLFFDKQGAVARREYLRDNCDSWLAKSDFGSDDFPFFRIITPVYRSTETLKRAVASVARQTFKSYVMVVCDDMSDEPFETRNEVTVASLGENGKFVRSTRKLYAGGARNTAMREVTNAKYTLFLDADDELADERCLEDLHGLIVDNGYPDVVSLPAWTDRDNRSSAKAHQLIVSPEMLAMGNHQAPWSKAVKTEIVPKFKEGMRRSNDVFQHFCLVDSAKSVIPFPRDFIRYRIDGETTMWGAAKAKNIMSVESISCLLKCATDLLTHSWTHEYAARAASKCVRHIVSRMAPATLINIGDRLEGIMQSCDTPERFDIETLSIPLKRFVRMLGDRFIKSPVTMQEKIAHIKFFGVTKLMTKCADKLGMKEYAKEVLGEDISVPTIMVWSNPDDIDFDMLPARYALKCNHGCHFNIISDGRSQINKVEAKEALKKWLNTDYGLLHGEMQYTHINRMCFAEKYVGDGSQTTDYKFVCFNGVPTYCQVIKYRGTPRQHLNWYDMDWKFVDISRTDFVSNKNDLDEKPVSFEKMKAYAEKLAKPFDFVRVDFFELNGRPYLGELTFTPANATQKYIGDPNTSIKLGSMLKLTR